MKRNVLLFLLAVVCVAFTSSCVATGEVVTFDTSIADDASACVLDAVRRANAGEVSEINFEKGTYHFYPEKAVEEYVRVSNHNDVLARIGFMVDGAKNLTINGNGSEFIFHGMMLPFVIHDSENIQVKDLSIDFSEPFHVEAEVVATNAAAKTFDLKIGDEYPFEIRDNQVIFVQPYYTYTLGQSVYFDPKTKATAYKTNFSKLVTSKKIKPANQTGVSDIEYKYKIDPHRAFTKYVGAEFLISAEKIDENIVRVHNQVKDMPEVGWILVGKGEHGINRWAPAMKLNNTTNFYGENIKIHQASGMGFLAENSENIDLYKCEVSPSNGRILSTTADATHFVGCRGKVSLRSCEFRQQLDDATNVHGAYKEIVDVLGKNSVGVRAGHFQQLGFALGRPGDKIGIVRLSDSFEPYAVLTLKSNDMVNGRYHRITFEEDLPEGVAYEDLLENISAYPEVLVEDCIMAGNHARGLLISTPKGTIIRNNIFDQVEMGALLMPIETSLWYESGAAANVLIENNTFIDCSTSGAPFAVFRFPTDDASESIAFRNIKFINNKIEHFDTYLFDLGNVDGFVFENNTITNSKTFEPIFPEYPMARIKHSKNVTFKNNSYDGVAKKMIECVGDMEPIEFN